MFYVVVSTKGGVGKTTIAQQVLAPFVYQKTNKKVEIIELDNNNKSNVLNDSEVLEVKPVELHKKDEVLLNKFMEVVAEDKDVIVDVGGGDDTKRVLEAFKELRLEDEITFFVPVLKDLSNEKNVIDTWSLIRTWNTQAKIYFVLNRFTNEKEFSSILKKLNEVKEDTNKSLLFLEDTPLFDEIAKEFKKSVYEITLSELDNSKAKKLLVETAKQKDIKKLKEIKYWISVYDRSKKFIQTNLIPIFGELK